MSPKVNPNNAHKADKKKKFVSTPCEYKTSTQELKVFSDGTMKLTNLATGEENIWCDQDKDGKYDTRMDINTELLTCTSVRLNEKQYNVRKRQQELINLFKREENKKIEINGTIEKFKQGYTGDCWALAGIKALADTKKGAELIKNMIFQDKDGNVTVKLPGTGEVYKFTTKEINRAEGRLSIGDDDVRVLEMALEKHREKLIKAGASSGILEQLGLKDFRESVGCGTEKMPLDGGTGAEIFSIFTGKKPEISISQNGLQVAFNNLMQYFGGKATETYLDMIQKNPEKYAATTSFIFKKNAHITNGHYYSIRAVDKNNVYLFNPWDSSKLLKMKKSNFINNCEEIDFCDPTQK